MNATITLTGIQVTASNLPLPDASTWFDWYYERNLDFAANANIISSQIVVTTSIQNVSALGSAQVSTESIELNAEVSEVSLAGDAQFAFDGIELDGTPGDVFGLGAAQASAESIQLDTLVSEVSGSGDGQFQLDGNILELEIAEVYSAGDGQSELSGIILDLEIGEVIATAVNPVDASVEITGVALVSAVGNVSANAISSEILQLSGNPRRYSATQFKNNVVKIAGIDAKITTGRVSALGVISISGTAVLQNVGLYSEVQTVSAEGILSISEDELILLLAA